MAFSDFPDHDARRLRDAARPLPNDRHTTTDPAQTDDRRTLATWPVSRLTSTKPLDERRRAAAEPGGRTMRPVSRRKFLKAGLAGVAALGLYAGEVERHWTEVKHVEVALRGLPAEFEGWRVVQLSDIHLEEFTEAAFLQHVVKKINGLRPDAVFLTGDFVSNGPMSRAFSIRMAWECARILDGLECRERYAVMGNHDVMVGPEIVTTALQSRGITVLDNSYMPVERGGGRIWLAGVDDPVAGDPNPERAIPRAIRGRVGEPVVLMCHAPDYADELMGMDAGRAVDLMLSGHTHGGQVRLPIAGPLILPPLGKKYIEGLFRLGETQLYVNRGIGTVGVPFRFDCAPEITVLTFKNAGVRGQGLGIRKPIA